MKKLAFTLFFVLLFFGGIAQTKTIPMTQPTDITTRVRVIPPKGSIQVPTATLSSQAINLGQAQSTFVAKADSVPMSNFISGVDGQLVKMKGDSAVIGISNGTEGQIMKIVSGVPAWGSPSSALFAYTTVNDTTAKTELKNITGLSLSLEANSTYLVEANLNMHTDATGTTVGVGVNLSSVTGATMHGTFTGTATVASYTAAWVSYMDVFNTSSGGFFGTANTYGGIVYHGIVTTGSTAPTLYLQYRIAVGIVTVYPLSYVKATKI